MAFNVTQLFKDELYFEMQFKGLLPAFRISLFMWNIGEIIGFTYLYWRNKHCFAHEWALGMFEKLKMNQIPNYCLDLNNYGK